jgi:hypothetical protein
MKNSKLTPDQPVSVLTLAELQEIIVKIVKDVIQEQTHKQNSETVKVETENNHPPKELLQSFGSWEDTRTAEEIIADIYSSRTPPDQLNSL